LVVATKEIGLEVNSEKTKYMVMSCEDNDGQNHNTKTGNKSSKMVEEFKYLGTTLTDQNCIHEEIKSRLKSGNASLIRSSSLLSKNVKVKMYRVVILPVILCECETWSLTLTEEHRPRVFENKVLRKVFGPKKDEVSGEWRRLHNEELHALYSSPNFFG
jgi:hypothetical protein